MYNGKMKKKEINMMKILKRSENTTKELRQRNPY